VTQSQKTVQCEVQIESGQTVEGNSGHTDTEPTDGTVWCTEKSGQNIEGNIGQSDTEPTDGTVWGTDRKWTEFRRQQRT